MDKNEALRLALEALEDIGDEWGFTSQRTVPKRKEAITAIKEALAQTEPNYKKALEVWLDKTEWVQETVKPHELGMHRADVLKQRIQETLAQPEKDGECKYCTDGCPRCDARKLPEQDWIERERAVGYREGHRAALAQRTWVGLTDEEIRLQWSEFWEAECHPWAIDFAQAIEAKLRSKNNG
jgi:hypothetical protein